MHISEKLKIIRKKKKVNQEKFSKELGIGLSTIKRYENGERVPDYLFIEKLIKEYGINPIWLFLDDASDDIMLENIEHFYYSEYNQKILKDLTFVMTDEELHKELNSIFIQKILERFATSDEEKTPIYKFLEAIKLEGHIPIRPFLFLYYIFQFILQDKNKDSIESYREYLLDVILSYETLSWKNDPIFTKRIKNEISAKFELELSEEECKILVQNAEITLKKLEEKMPATMIKFHRNIKLKSLFPDKFKEN